MKAGAIGQILDVFALQNFRGAGPPKVVMPASQDVRWKSLVR